MKKRSAASDNPLPAPLPLQPPLRATRSCSRCVSKKTKCAPSLPYCGPCWSGGRTEECDMEQHIVLPYTAAKEKEVGEDERRRRIEWLEREMGSRTGVDIAGIATGSTISEPTRELGRVPVDPLSLELGLLALESSGAPSQAPRYVGTSSGLTITRLLAALLRSDENGEDNFGQTDSIPSRRPAVCAGIPPVEIARNHLETFLDRIHSWLPFLSLSNICSLFDSLYEDQPQMTNSSTSDYDRFLFFAVLAIGSAESRSLTTLSSREPFEPREYFAAALPFFERIAGESDSDPLTPLLLVIIYGMTDASGPSINLWIYIGHAMRVAIELGLTRPSSAWGLSPEEEERRRRIWWCVYRLERTVAVRLGRVLSIRNQGIDAEWPRILDETSPACRILPNPKTSNYRPGMHLVRLSTIYGEILESVYIARPIHRPSMTIEETLQRVWSIQNSLVEWANSIPTIAAPQTSEFNILTLAFHRACLLLHRPSPSFPNQPDNVHSVCIRSARAAIKLSLSMLNDKVLSRNWQNFHDSFVDGICLMFSSWASPTSTNAITGLDTTRDQDLSNCSLVLLGISSSLPPSASRYIAIFDQVISSFERLIGVGASTIAATDEFFFDWSVFEQNEGFELDQDAVELIRMLTSGEGAGIVGNA